jgi:hypothetical protein
LRKGREAEREEREREEREKRERRGVVLWLKRKHP